jgi:hypothetical protein
VPDAPAPLCCLKTGQLRSDFRQHAHQRNPIVTLSSEFRENYHVAVLFCIHAAQGTELADIAGQPKSNHSPQSGWTIEVSSAIVMGHVPAHGGRV